MGRHEQGIHGRLLALQVARAIAFGGLVHPTGRTLRQRSSRSGHTPGPRDRRLAVVLFRRPDGNRVGLNLKIPETAPNQLRPDR